MNKDKLEQVEQVLDKIRDSFLFPRPEMNSTLEKDTRKDRKSVV